MGNVCVRHPIAKTHQSPRNKVLVHSPFFSEPALMKLIIRKAVASWKGGTKSGTQALTTQSGALQEATFSLGTPLQNGSHTDPAELIAAAHASSFSLALSNELGLGASAV